MRTLQGRAPAATAIPTTPCELPSPPEPRGIKPCSTSPPQAKAAIEHSVFKIAKRQLVKTSEPSQPPQLLPAGLCRAPRGGDIRTSSPRCPSSRASRHRLRREQERSRRRPWWCPRHGLGAGGSTAGMRRALGKTPAFPFKSPK